jgi:WD40 repeat protein
LPSFVRTVVGHDYKLVELKQKKDCKEDISDIKFSPNSKFLAVGSHDNFIDIYGIKLATATCKYLINIILIKFLI